MQKRTPLQHQQISKWKRQKQLSLRTLLEVELFKKCARLLHETHFEAKMVKTPHVHTIVEKCARLWREAPFEVKRVKNWRSRTTFYTFWSSDAVVHGRRNGFYTPQTVSQTRWFCGSFKNDGRRGTLEEELQRCISCGRHNTREISIRVGRPGPWFHETVAFWSIGSSGLLRWFCVTGAALRMTWPPSFVAIAILWSSGMGKSQNALARGHQLCTQLSCIFDVAPFQTWGSLTFFSFWTSELLIFEDVLQKCFVLDLSISTFEGRLAS